VAILRNTNTSRVRNVLFNAESAEDAEGEEEELRIENFELGIGEERLSLGGSFSRTQQTVRSCLRPKSMPR
jgi:hypothetical protein